MRNRIAAILLWLSWPVCLIHDFWYTKPVTPVSWIIFDKTVRQDFRWFYVAMELWLSAVFVLLAWLISTKKTRTLQILIKANVWISVFDLVHYWLFFRRNEWFLAVEGMIMAVGTILIIKHESISHNEKAT